MVDFFASSLVVGFIVASLVVAWVAAILVLLDAVIDGSTKALIVLVLFLVVPLGAFINYASENEKPCAQYETKLMYNASTKTTMPMRVCVQHGEWMEDGE